MESQTFNDNISEKVKIESLKTETISSLESTISALFQKELNTMKEVWKINTELLLKLHMSNR